MARIAGKVSVSVPVDYTERLVVLAPEANGFVVSRVVFHWHSTNYIQGAASNMLRLRLGLGLKGDTTISPSGSSTGICTRTVNQTGANGYSIDVELPDPITCSVDHIYMASESYGTSGSAIYTYELFGDWVDLNEAEKAQFEFKANLF